MTNIDENTVSHCIIKYFVKTPEEIEEYFNGTSEDKDAIPSEEIVAEIHKDVAQSIDFWAREKGFTYISHDEISRSDVDYIEVSLLPTSFVYLVKESQAHPWKKS